MESPMNEQCKSQGMAKSDHKVLVGETVKYESIVLGCYFEDKGFCKNIPGICMTDYGILIFTVLINWQLRILDKFYGVLFQ